MEGNYGLEFLGRLAFRILFIGVIRFLKSMWILHRRFLAAIKSLPYDVPCEFILFGDGHQNPNYIELVSRISEEEFNAAVCDIAILAQRTKIVPYQDSGLVVVVPVRKLSHSPWTSLRTFTTDTWVGTVGLLNCGSSCLDSREKSKYCISWGTKGTIDDIAMLRSNNMTGLLLGSLLVSFDRISPQNFQVQFLNLAF